MNVIRKEARLSQFRYAPNRRIYIAARYGRKEEALSYAQVLESLGFQIMSTWIHQVEDEMLYGEGPGAAGRFAIKDYDDIRSANVLLYLSEPEDNLWGRGGRHVEFGYAAALNKLLYVVGPLENLFHYHPDVLQFDDFDTLIAFLIEGA